MGVKPFSARDEEIKFEEGEDFNNVAFTDTLFGVNEEEQKERDEIINNNSLNNHSTSKF